jgi:biofilm protein TabA
MIVDTLRNIDRYFDFSPSLKKCYEFVQREEFCFQTKQTIQIGTKGIYAIPQEYSPKNKEDLLIEAHRKYIDVQVMVEGVEYLGYAEKNSLTFAGYDEDHDTERLTGTLAFLPFLKDSFAVLFPQDAHMPGVNHQGSTKTVKKIVIKIPLELW